MSPDSTCLCCGRGELKYAVEPFEYRGDYTIHDEAEGCTKVSMDVGTDGNPHIAYATEEDASAGMRYAR